MSIVKLANSVSNASSKLSAILIMSADYLLYRKLGRKFGTTTNCFEQMSLDTTCLKAVGYS